MFLALEIVNARVGLDMREKYAYDVIIIQPCSQRKPNQVRSYQELSVCVAGLSVGRALRVTLLDRV